MRSLSKSIAAARFSRLSVQLGELVIGQAQIVLAPLNITPRDYDALRCIAQGQGLSQQELGKLMGIFSSRMVALIDELERRGLVIRTVSTADRRRYVLSLTKGGEALLLQADMLAEKLHHTLFGDVTDDETARMQALVDRLALLPCAVDPLRTEP